MSTTPKQPGLFIQIPGYNEPFQQISYKLADNPIFDKWNL